MKKAFTMLELIFVIVVVGIISVMIAPSFEGNKLREAADQLVSHIRYTQHLAMMDNRYNYFNSNINQNSSTYWFRSRWQIVFTDSSTRYSIYSDGSSGGNYDGNSNEFEMAVDPLDNSKVLSSGSNGFLSTNSKANEKLDLKNSYGIDAVTFVNADGSTNGCKNSTRLTFDYLGRPITGVIKNMLSPYENNKLIKIKCNIILSNSDNNITIQIEPETGYTHIL